VVVVGAPSVASGSLPQQGVPDPTFGLAGQLTTDVAGAWDRAEDVAVHPDGRIVAVGAVYRGDATSYDFGIVRYLPSGALDTSFGAGGRVFTDFGVSPGQLGSPNIPAAVALQPDGRMIVVGHVWSNSAKGFALARYQFDGSLDSTFGDGGRVVTDIQGRHGVATSVAIHPSGDIYVGGYTEIGSTWEDFVLARYHADGSLDTSFGNAGSVVTDFADATRCFQSDCLDRPEAIALGRNGRVILAGWSRENATSREVLALAAYNSGGTADATFGSNGRVVTDIHSDGMQDRANDVAIQPDGYIVVAGMSQARVPTGQAFDVAVARFTTAGTLDPSFGAGGVMTTDFASNDDSGEALLLQPDGRILVAGTTASPPPRRFALLRYTVHGHLDPTFGNGGAVRTGFSNLAYATSAALAPEGKAVLLGSVITDWGGVGDGSGDTHDFALARYIVGDTAPPTLRLPESVTSKATSLAGATVAFVVTASDNMDPNPVVICTPPSGSTFPIGTTTVTCTATDAAGNTSSGSFTVDVSALVVDHVTLQFVGERGSPSVRWEGTVGPGVIAGSTANGRVQWLAADAACFGDPAVTLSMNFQSLSIGSVLTGSLTATRGGVRIQVRQATTPLALLPDGTVKNNFPIRATHYDGRNIVFGSLTMRLTGG
jgi:uncharacterized delta-60 repeat protein